MAKQLYDYWFVQFDFPNEKGKPYKSSGGGMVWNEKLHREIPHDWDVVNLSEYLNVYTEKVSANNLGTSCKYAPIEVLPRRRMSFNECSPIENAVSDLCRFRKKQILLSNRRVYFHKVCIAAFDGVTRDTVIILNPKNKALLGYAYQIVNDDAFIEYATRLLSEPSLKGAEKPHGHPRPQPTGDCRQFRHTEIFIDKDFGRDGTGWRHQDREPCHYDSKSSGAS